MVITLTNEQTTDLLDRLYCYINQFPLKPEAQAIFYKDGTINKDIVLKIIDEAKHRVINQERNFSMFTEIYHECISIIDKIIY